MHIAIRTDASAAIGLGHLSRCLALADELAQAGASVTFLCSNPDAAAADWIGRKSHSMRTWADGEDGGWEADAMASIVALPARPDWLIVDHYALDCRWEQRLRPQVDRLAVIDDLADRHHHCDLLVDQTFGRDASAYAHLVQPDCLLALGTRYAMLRPAFARVHGSAPAGFERPRIHVFLGGGRPAKCLPRFVSLLLAAVPDITVAAVGGIDPRLDPDVRAVGSDRITWVDHVDDMASHMARCDIAIGAPGMATWERACVGLPSAYLATVPNQVAILQRLDTEGFCRYLGRADAIQDHAFVGGVAAFLANRPGLHAMRAVGLAQVDGRGVQRIARCLRDGSLADD